MLATHNAIPNTKNDEGFWARSGGRTAGQAYFYSNIAWITLGTLTDPTLQMAIAGAINFSGSRARIQYSDQTAFNIPNFGNKFGAGCGVLANLVVTAGALLALNPLALLSNAVIGAAAFIDIRSGRYRALYENSPSRLTRETLGHARRLVGLLRGASRIPLLALCAGTGNIPLGVITAALLLADTMYAFSAPQKEYTREKEALRALSNIVEQLEERPDQTGQQAGQKQRSAQL